MKWNLFGQKYKEKARTELRLESVKMGYFDLGIKGSKSRDEKKAKELKGWKGCFKG